VLTTFSTFKAELLNTQSIPIRDVDLEPNFQTLEVFWFQHPLHVFRYSSGSIIQNYSGSRLAPQPCF